MNGSAVQQAKGKNMADTNLDFQHRVAESLARRDYEDALARFKTARKDLEEDGPNPRDGKGWEGALAQALARVDELRQQAETAHLRYQAVRKGERV